MRQVPILVLLLSFFIACQSKQENNHSLTVERDSTTVEIKTFYQEIAGFGTIKGARSTELKAHFSGYFYLNLRPIPEYGKGELIYQLKGPEIEQLRQQYRAAAEVARANFRFVQEMLERKKNLQTKHYIPVEEWEKLQRDVRRYRAQKIQADSALAYFEKMVRFRAPFSGVLQNLQVNQGEYVRADELLAEFQSTDNLILEGEYFGQQPIFSTDSPIQVILNDSLRTKGQFIFLEKAVNPQTGGRHFRVRLNQPPLAVQPGEYVKYRLQFSPFQAPAVPEEALIREKGKYYLVELHRGTIRVREVVPGIHNGRFYQLIRGPAPGTYVLTTGAFQVFHSRLKETMKIED